MLIVDDILFFPARSLLWIFRELNNAVQEEIESEGEAITTELSELYMLLETGKITEDEFDNREKELLDRLDEFENQGLSDDEEDEDEDEEDEDEETEIPNNK